MGNNTSTMIIMKTTKMRRNMITNTRLMSIMNTSTMMTMSTRMTSIMSTRMMITTHISQGIPVKIKRNIIALRKLKRVKSEKNKK
jgi:hypothetical protein